MLKPPVCLKEPNRSTIDQRGDPGIVDAGMDPLKENLGSKMGLIKKCAMDELNRVGFCKPIEFQYLWSTIMVELDI